MTTIICVCTANVCRSPMAAALLKTALDNRGDIEVLSAGVSAIPNAGPSENAARIMGQVGIDISGHTSTQLTEDLVQRSSLILVMTRSHKNEILRSFPDAGKKVKLLGEYNAQKTEKSDDNLDIRDPIGLPLEDYQHCYHDIKKAIEGVTQAL